MDVHGRTFDVSNADRVVYPAIGVTKGDVVAHYARMAELVLPHVRGRPLTILRAPGGADGQQFMQKQAGKHYPPWITRVRTPKREGGAIDMPAADEPAVLAYLAQQGTLEVHAWLSAAPALDRPLDLVLDLDPSGDPADDPRVLADVRLATRTVRHVLADLGIEADLKTSGSRGYHVVAKLDGATPIDTAKDVARAVAERVATAEPDTCTTAFAKDEREGRVFVDWLRNGYAQTVVAPYSLRARPTAPVSTPIDWDELSRVAPTDHTISTIPRRLAQRPCPWADRADRPGQPLGALIERLGLA